MRHKISSGLMWIGMACAGASSVELVDGEFRRAIAFVLALMLTYSTGIYLSSSRLREGERWGLTIQKTVAVLYVPIGLLLVWFATHNLTGPVNMNGPVNITGGLKQTGSVWFRGETSFDGNVFLKGGDFTVMDLAGQPVAWIGERLPGMPRVALKNGRGTVMLMLGPDGTYNIQGALTEAK
jgi:hypothetical protein